MHLTRIEGDPVPAAVLPAVAEAVAVLGATGFYPAFSGLLEAAMPLDRMYLIDGNTGDQPLIARTEPDKPSVSGAAYVSHFLPADPLQQAIAALDGPDAVVRLVAGPADIAVPAYRQMLERSGVVQRVSFLRRQGRAAWRCLTVVRRRQLGPFADAELHWLGGYFRLTAPLVDRHRALTGEVIEDRAERIAELEQRFADLNPDLTPRERQVCARAAIGISVEGAALDLGVAPSSVVTYRKRAYHRLGVSSAYELARLVLR